MPERIYMGSVHNIINIDSDTVDGRLLVALVDTPEFQRLRRVRQLGLAYFAYQSGQLVDIQSGIDSNRNGDHAGETKPQSQRHRSGKTGNC